MQLGGSVSEQPSGVMMELYLFNAGIIMNNKNTTTTVIVLPQIIFIDHMISV